MWASMHLTTNPNIRNIAIIAHVDHGKTTLVDALFRQSGVFQAHQEIQERMMDRLDLERERGITIAAKNCAIVWKGVKINIIDTPGHADFSGEVERALSMVDGAILLVDAAEGPLPQTRFVLRKALETNKRIIVVINKIDRSDARPNQVLNEIYDLFIDLDADEDQLNFPLFYAIGREGIAQKTLEERGTNLHVLLDGILEEIPPPRHTEGEPFQLLVSDLDYSDYLGRLCVGKVYHGSIKAGQDLVRIDINGQTLPLKVSKIQGYRGISLAELSEAQSGDIVVLAGAEAVEIGDTITIPAQPRRLPRLLVEEPTVAMTFWRNTSPFSGREGRWVQAQRIEERLKKEALRNVSIRIETSADRENFVVMGRGEFQLAIIIETMRREGYEFCVGRPQVIFKERNQRKQEPIERLFVECSEDYTGIVTEKLGIRKGRLLNFTNHGHGRVRLEFSVPSRALIGYRDEFLTDTRGTGIMNSYLEGYEDYRGDFPSRTNGSLVSDREGAAVAYALFNLEPRGRLFIVPSTQVYRGMIIGEHNRENDLYVNPCREKKLTNIRAAGRDDNVILTPVIPMTLEAALNFLREDELLEVTPKSLRLLKKESLQA
jgi:GTP-binding protein